MDGHGLHTRGGTARGWWSEEEFPIGQVDAGCQRTVERPIRRAVDLIVRAKGQKTPTPCKVFRRETDMPQRLLPCSARTHAFEGKVPDVLPVNDSDAY